MEFKSRKYKKWILREWKCCGLLWQLLVTSKWYSRLDWRPICPVCNTQGKLKTVKKKQIRFMRPNPQSYINDIFLRGAKSERTMMIIVDGYFRGHPDHIPPHKEIPKLLTDGQAAEEKTIEIFKSIMKQLQITNWKFRIPTDIGMSRFVEIMEKYTKKPIKETKHKLMIEKTRSLLVFASYNGPSEFGLKAIKEYLKYGKQVCVVDPHGVKRYPRERK